MPRQGLAHEMSMAFDRYSNAFTVIEQNHRMIHDGFFFSAGYRNAALANLSSIEILIDVPALTFPHFQQLRINSDGGGFEVEFFEGATTSASGTTITPVNRNRNSTNTLATLVYHTPTVTGDGTSIGFQLIPDGVGPPQAVTWDERELGEFILKPSTKYLLRVKNISGAARDVQVVMGGYEIGDDH